MRIFPITSKDAKRSALQAVWSIRGEDGLEVVIRKIKSHGTREQQAWFNIMVKMIADETGNSPEAIKAHIKEETFGKQTATIGGKVIEFIPRSDWDGKEGYSQLIENAYRIAADMGIVLPDPKHAS